MIANGQKRIEAVSELFGNEFEIVRDVFGIGSGSNIIR